MVGSTTTNRHGVAAFHFELSPVAISLVVGPTHARCGTLDLCMVDDVPDLVRVAVVAPIDNSDHSSLSAVISMAQADPNLCVSFSFLTCMLGKFFSNNKSTGIQSVVQYRICPGVTFDMLTNLLGF